jgi:glc operon protein GlcG
MKPIHLPTRLVALAIGAALLAAGEARAQVRPAPAKVEDSAHLFGAEAVAKAEALLKQAAMDAANLSSFREPVTIETIDSLRGDPIDEVAEQRARRSGDEGLYVLIAKNERKIEVVPGRRSRDAFPASTLRVIRDAFIEGLRGDDKDEGLRKGVEAIVRALPGPTRRESGLSPSLTGRDHPTRTGADARHLVERDRVRLSLAGAQQIIEGAIRKAEEMKLKMNIAVVDDGGHPLCFARMDGARPASAYTANTKAITAATFRQATGPVMPPGASAPDVLLNLSLQNAAAASGGKVTTLFGGVPVVVEGQVIGGVGVGGGSGEQDATVARAGVESFLSALGEAKPAAGSEPARAADEKK